MDRDSADRRAMMWTVLFALALALTGCQTHTPAELRYWCLERANRRATIPEGGVPEDREAMVDRLYCACLESVEIRDPERCT